MKLQLPFRLRTSAALVLILCVSLACGAGAGGATRVASGAEAEAVAVDVGLGPGAFDLADTRVELAGLSSYKATLTLRFDGTQGGQAQQWSSTFEMIRIREPLASQLNVRQTGSVSEGDPELPEFMAEKDGATYQRLAAGVCTASVTDVGNSLMDMLEPAGQLRTVFGASTAGHEAVNSIEAEKYTFDERALARNGLSESTGEMWVSSEGGYVVRYVLTARGDEDFFGTGMEGTMTWDYELSEVNQSILIELPADCPLGLISAPMLPDAVNVLSVPGLLQYDTAASVVDVRAFYETELPKLGWTVPISTDPPEGMSAEEYQQLLDDMEALGLNEPTPTPNPNEAVLDFQLGNQSLSIIITVANGVTHVQVFLTRAVE